MRVGLGVDPGLHQTAAAVVVQHKDGVCALAGAKMFRPYPTDSHRPSFQMQMIEALHPGLAAWLSAVGLHPEVAAIEGQQIYAGPMRGRKRTPNFDDVLVLGPISGAAAASALSAVTNSYGLDRARVFIPKPAEWKGQAKKFAHQERDLRRVGAIEIEPRAMASGGYAYPKTWLHPTSVEVAKQFGISEWEHVGDAIGLALWALARPA